MLRHLSGNATNRKTKNPPAYVSFAKGKPDMRRRPLQSQTRKAMISGRIAGATSAALRQSRITTHKSRRSKPPYAASSWPFILESHLARARVGQTRVLRMLLHGFGLKYRWNGPQHGWNTLAR